MIKEALKNFLKLAMASFALLIISNHFNSNVSFTIFGTLFILCGISLGIINTIDSNSKRTRSEQNADSDDINYGEGNEALTEQQKLVEDFINKAIEYCNEQGENCTLMNQQDGLWIVRVNDETGTMDKIMNLSLPAEEDVTKDNIESITNRTIEELSVKLKQLKD